MSAVLEMRDVFIALGRGARRQQVLDGIDLSVEPGRTVGLIGASGSGRPRSGGSPWAFCAPMTERWR